MVRLIILLHVQASNYAEKVVNASLWTEEADHVLYCRKRSKAPVSTKLFAYFLFERFYLLILFALFVYVFIQLFDDFQVTRFTYFTKCLHSTCNL